MSCPQKGLAQNDIDTLGVASHHRCLEFSQDCVSCRYLFAVTKRRSIFPAPARSEIDDKSFAVKTQMKTTTLIFGLCVSAPISFAQNPNQQWVYPPYNINMNGNTPVVTSIPGATAGSNNISNGAYDANGTLLFYVKDLNVYTGSASQLKGKLPMPGAGGHGCQWIWEGAEIEIVPVPGSGLCNKFYVIYTVKDLNSLECCLLYATIDCSSGTPVSIGPAFNSTLSSTYYSQNLLQWLYFDAQGLAVSKLTLNNTTRYLFTVGFHGNPNLALRNAINYGGLLRWTIDALGIHNQQLIARDDLDLGNYYAYDTWQTVTQMSLSDDQTRLAWGGGTRNQTYNCQQHVFEVKLNPSTYSYGGSYHQYCLPYYGTLPSPQTTFVSGVEYVPGTNKLYVSTREGLYIIPSYAVVPVLLGGTSGIMQQPLSGMSGSQLQYVKAIGKIVGVKVTNTAANTGLLYSIDPLNNNTAIILPSPPLTSWDFVIYYGGKGFTLPDQVDTYPSSIPTLNAALAPQAKACAGSDITASGSYTGTATPNQYSWHLYQCDVNGNQIAGYDSGILTPSSAGAFTFPNTSTLPCGNYYKITFTAQNTGQCLTSAATQIIYINCAPVPVISGPTTICYGSSTTLCANYPNDSQTTVEWVFHTGTKPNVHIHSQCITVNPKTNTTYSVTVTDNATGCKGKASVTVTVANNNPDFTYQTQYQSPNNYFTVTAKPVTPYSNGVPGFGDLWIIEEVDSAGNPKAGTNTGTGSTPNPQCWWTYPSPISFPGFNGTNNVTCPTPSPGQFTNGHIYKITHGTWNNFCPWAQASHTVAVSGHRRRPVTSKKIRSR